MNHFSPTRSRVRAIAVTVFFAVLLVTTWSFSTPTASADPEPTEPSPNITITEITPEILVNEDEVTIKVRITADAGDQLEGAWISAFIHADPFTSIAEVDGFLTEGRNDGWEAHAQPLTASDVEHAASGGAEITIRIPFDQLPLWNASAWGPYGVTVHLIPSSNNRSFEVVQDRTLLIWYAPGSDGQIKVNVTVTEVPQTLPPDSWSSLQRSGTTLTLAQEDLRVLLANNPGHGLEVASIPAGNASLSMLATTGQTELYRLAASTRALTPSGAGEQDLSSSQEVLPEDDSGKSATPQSGLQTSDYGLLETGRDVDAPVRRLIEALDRFDVTLLDDLVIADADWWGLQLLQAAQGDTVLTSTNGVEELPSDLEVPSSRFLVDPATGSTIVSEVPSLVESQSSVNVLDSWSTGAEALSSESHETLGDLAARQRVRALTALAVTQEGVETAVWISVPAQQLGEDPTARIAELLDSPWVEPVTLEEMLATPYSKVAREPVRLSVSDAQMETALQLTPLTEELAATEDVLTASVDGQRPTVTELLPVLAATAPSLTVEQRQVRINSALDILGRFTKTIDVIPSGPVNVVGRNAPFPVTVRNSGPYALEIYVGLQGTDPRLSTTQWVPTVIPSGGSVTVQVPVEAVGTGQVEVTAVAKTEGGTTLDTSDPITVRVSADWEGPGLWVAAALLAFAVAAGIARTIRKGKRRMSNPLPTNSDEDLG